MRPRYQDSYPYHGPTGNFFNYIVIFTCTNISNLIKKAISIYLIALLGFISFGLSLFYCAAIQLCKIKAEKFADDDDAGKDKTTILFSSANRGFKVINKHEILADGKMYDIVKTKLCKGIKWYYTVSDTDEDDFILNLTNLEKSNPDEKSFPAKIIKLYDLKYFDIKNNTNSTCLWVLVPPGLKTTHGHLFCPLLFKDIFSPPPNRLLS